MNFSLIRYTNMEGYVSQLAQAFGVFVRCKNSTDAILIAQGDEALLKEESKRITVTLDGAKTFYFEVFAPFRVLENHFPLIEQSLKLCLKEQFHRCETERYEMFLDASADWFWETDVNGRFIYLSGKVEEVFGISAQEIIGKNRRELYQVQQDLSSSHWQNFLGSTDRRQSFSDFETVWKRPDGDRRHIVLSGRPVFDADNSFMGYRGTGLDVTEKKRAQIDFQNLVEGSIQGICIHRHWKFLFVNQALVDMCGYNSAREFLDVGFVDKMIAPYELDRLHGFRMAKERGEQVETHHIADYLTKNGEIKTLESINSLIEWEGKKAILSTVIDVTQQRKTQQKLQDHRDRLQELVEERTQELMTSEQRLRTVVETASDWFWETDEQHHVVFISDRFYELSDFNPDDVLGKSRLKIVEQQMRVSDSSGMWKNHLDDLKHHRPFSIRYWSRGFRAGEVCIEIKGKPLFDGQGRFKGYIGAGSDVTHAVETEKALRIAVKEAESANRAKSDFLSNMSHELRTPLNAILGFAQLLENNISGNLTDTQLIHLQHIRLGGEHLLELVNEILDLSKIESGKLTLVPENVDLHDLVGLCLPYAKAFAEKYDVTIEDRTLTQGHVVWADALRAKQALLNLMANAAKYNRPGGKVWIELDDIDTTYIRLSVHDNGIGIRAEDQDKIFQPFQRAAGQDGMIEGTGIGLVLTKKLLEEMGGHIGFRSTFDQGSIFWLDFPRSTLQREDAAALNHSMDLERPVCAPQNQYTLLYVEDNPSNLSLMEGIVDCIPNLRMVSAHTAEIGLTMLQAQKPDLVLLDINLPGMDGFQAIREIRALDDIRHIPVFAISADAMSDSLEKGEKAGFDKYLTKPIDLPEFMTLLDDVLK